MTGPPLATCECFGRNGGFTISCVTRFRPFAFDGLSAWAGSAIHVKANASANALNDVRVIW